MSDQMTLLARANIFLDECHFSMKQSCPFYPPSQEGNSVYRMKKNKNSKVKKMLLKECIDESEFIRWLLETMDESLLQEAVKNFKIFVAPQGRR